MSKSAKKIQRKKILMSMDTELAKQIQVLSERAGTSPQNILAALVWIGKKAFGRNVKIESDDEKLRLSISSFAEFPKLTPLDEE